jgi:hypothetical protein
MLGVRTVQDGRHPTKIRLRRLSRLISTLSLVFQARTCVHPETRRQPYKRALGLKAQLRIPFATASSILQMRMPSKLSFNSESSADPGLLNKNMVVARALLGAVIGQKRDVAPPMSKRTIRVLET